MDKIDKAKFINDIKRDLGIKEKEYYTKEKRNKDEKIGEFGDFNNLGEIFSAFFKNNDTESIMNNPNNIYVTCKIKKDEANKGCTKDIRIKRIKQDDKIKKINIHIKIPQNIKSEQQIILKGEGNRNNNCIGNLVVKIIVK